MVDLFRLNCCKFYYFIHGSKNVCYHIDAKNFLYFEEMLFHNLLESNW